MKSRFFTTDTLLIDVSQVVAVYCPITDESRVLLNNGQTFWLPLEDGKQIQQAVLDHERDMLAAWSKPTRITNLSPTFLDESTEDSK